MTEKQEKYELAKIQAVNALINASSSLFFDVQKFEHAQRVAKMLSTSSLVPEHFRQNLGNCVIALNYADRIKADPFMVMQNMYVVHGKPGIEGKLVIALINQCGRFEPLEFDENAQSCTAYAKEIKSGKVLKGPTVNMAMVKAEGWLDKTGSKWKTMPQIMFRYRAATFFARTYCPEVLLGMQTVEELEDILDLQLRKNGVYEAPEAPEIDPFDKSRFTDLVADRANKEPNETQTLVLVERFIKESAKVLGSEAVVKAEALKDFDDFWKQFKKWAKTLETEPESPTEKPEIQLKGFKCPHENCGFESASERGLKKHITQQHSNRSISPTKPQSKIFSNLDPEARQDAFKRIYARIATISSSIIKDVEENAAISWEDCNDDIEMQEEFLLFCFTLCKKAGQDVGVFIPKEFKDEFNYE
jgi:hypothetical protein